MSETSAEAQKDGVLQTPDFRARYANNTQLVATLWDMRMSFGEICQTPAGTVSEQHTAITMPWNQVKLLAYLLAAQVEVYELQFGKIPLPSHVWPLAPQLFLSSEDPGQRQAAEYLTALFRHNFGSLPIEPVTKPASEFLT